MRIWQYCAIVPLHRVTCGGIGERPEQVPPCEYLAQSRLHASEVLGARNLKGLCKQTGDELYFHCKARAAMEARALEEPGALAEEFDLAKASVDKDVFPRYEHLV